MAPRQSRKIQNGLALLPLNRLNADPEKRVFAVCSCGEWGCASVRCDVVKSWDGHILFRDFTIDPLHSEPIFNRLMFNFSIANYDAVVSDIFDEIKAYEAG